MHFSIDRTVHTTAFDKPVVDHWLERKIAQTAAGSTEKDRSDDRPLQMRARYRLSYIPLPSMSERSYHGATSRSRSPRRRLVTWKEKSFPTRSSVVRAFTHGAIGRRIDPS